MVKAKVVPSSPILVTLMMDEITSFEMSAFTRDTWRNIAEDSTLHSHRRRNINSHTTLTVWAVQQKSNMFPVMYELGYYIPEDNILRNHRRENNQILHSIKNVGSVEEN
jgi:hypothetical protein